MLKQVKILILFVKFDSYLVNFSIKFHWKIFYKKLNKFGNVTTESNAKVWTLITFNMK